MLVQYLPGDSLLHRLDPRTKVVAVLCAAVSVLAAADWQGLGLAALPVLASVALTRLPARVFLHGLRGFWVLLAITFLVQLFTIPGEMLLELGPLGISREGLEAATLIFLRLSLLILAPPCSPDHIPDQPYRRAGEHPLPFRRLGLPAHELAMMMTIALRFIPTLLRKRRSCSGPALQGAFSAGNPARWAKACSAFCAPLCRCPQAGGGPGHRHGARCYRGGANRTRSAAFALQP